MPFIVLCFLWLKMEDKKNRINTKKRFCLNWWAREWQGKLKERLDEKLNARGKKTVEGTMNEDKERKKERRNKLNKRIVTAIFKKMKERKQEKIKKKTLTK